MVMLQNVREICVRIMEEKKQKEKPFIVINYCEIRIRIVSEHQLTVLNMGPSRVQHRIIPAAI